VAAIPHHQHEASCLIVYSAQPGYGVGRARTRFDTCRSAASYQHECAVRGRLFHTGVLQRDVFEKRTGESAELLPNLAGAG
jgi:hypothetical protein